MQLTAVQMQNKATQLYEKKVQEVWSRAEAAVKTRDLTALLATALALANMDMAWKKAAAEFEACAREQKAIQAAVAAVRNLRSK